MGQSPSNICLCGQPDAPVVDEELATSSNDRKAPRFPGAGSEGDGEVEIESERVEEAMARKLAEEASKASALAEIAKASALAKAEEEWIQKQEALTAGILEQQRRDADAADAAFEEEACERKQTRRATVEEYTRLLATTKKAMTEKHADDADRANRYGTRGKLPDWSPEYIPFIALVNPSAGAGAGRDIIFVARRSEPYKDRFFNIIDVVRSQQRGGLLDLVRDTLQKVKEEAKVMGVRPRLISGGGDGTASFALWMIFKALQSNNARADEGLKDSGNGFIWDAAEFEAYFPALAQLPLGSANDFGNILGWGQKFPGDGKVCCGTSRRFAALETWVRHVIEPASQVVNFDLWGLMPPAGRDSVNFKICELGGHRGRKPHQKIDGKSNLTMHEAGKPTPFFICLYFSSGFGAYMVARFQINRRKTPFRNRIEYVRQGAGIVLENTPPQLNIRAEGITVDCEGDPYFPPRRDKGVRGKAYREVGFYNINWQAHLAHGADRAGLCTRLGRLCLCAGTAPVCFNDGYLDMYRMRFTTYLKNPGNVMQTDKKKDLSLSFSGGKGKGIFFQYDGEARFAFSPKGEPFNLDIRKVLNIPVVLGPYRSRRLTEPVDNGMPVRFEFHGDNEEEQQRVRRRILKSLSDELEKEVHATKEEIAEALHLAE